MYNLKPDNYYTQRNNKKRPMSACNVTSKVMYDIIMGWQKEYHDQAKKTGLSYDDFLMSIIETDKAWSKLKSWDKSFTNPWEWLRMYPEYLEVILFGEQRSFVDWDLTFDKCKDLADMSKPVMIAGSYIYKKGRKKSVIGHYNCVIGHEADNIILADPFGDFSDFYTNEKGYGIPMSREQFKYHIHKSKGKYYGMYPKGIY